MKRLFATALLALAAGCGGGAPSSADCEKIADHMLDILGAPPGQSKENVKASEAWVKTLKSKDHSREALLTMCSKQLKSAHVECLMAATDEKGLAKCLGAGS